MIVQDQSQVWSIDLTRFHGPNVAICEVVTSKRTQLIGAHPPLSTLEHLPDLAEALTKFYHQNPILLGDLNAHNSFSHQAIDMLMEFGLMDL